MPWAAKVVVERLDLPVTCIGNQYEPAHDEPTRFVRPAKTQISLRICAVWSESSLLACVIFGTQAIQRGINENPCHTAWMYKLILVFPDLAGLGGSVGCVVRLETRRSRVQPSQRSATFLLEIDHELFFMVILSIPLIQEGQLSVSVKRMCTILVNRLED